MVSREMKIFHEENRIHFSEKELSGTELTIQNAVNAPMDFKIFGAGLQKTSVQGKNLYDMDKGFDNVTAGTFEGAYLCDKTKISETEWMFDNMTKGGSNIAYFIVPLAVSQSTQYTLSLTVNRTRGTDGGIIGIGNNLTPDQWNISAGVYWNSKVPEVNTDTRISMSFNSGNNETVYFKGYFSYGASADDSCIFKEMQLEKGSMTAYEPFIPNSPSAEYPSEIIPSKNILLKCSNETKTNSTKIPDLGYAIEVSDIAKSNITVGGKYYIADYIEYDSKTDKAVRHKYIDEALLDYTLPAKDQMQAIRSVPLKEAITPSSSEYDFKAVKTIQDGCGLSVETYGEDDMLPLPLNIKIKAKVIK